MAVQILIKLRVMSLTSVSTTQIKTQLNKVDYINDNNPNENA